MARSAPYDVEVSGSRVTLAVQSSGAGTTATAVASAEGTASSASTEHFEVTGIDFRRGANGESRVLVDMNRPGVNISVSEQTGGLRVVLFNSELPDDLYQRLDVTDFATPAQMITPEQRGDNVRLNV